MRNCLTTLKSMLLLTGILLLGYGCTETPQIYTHPEWLGGSNIETLEKEGDCSIFLELMERANYTEPIEKQLFALFVPRDSAFRAYFERTGINSVQELSDEEAFRLFTMYVIPNPLSRYQLIYENAWEQESPEGEYGALFFRKKTRSILRGYTETPLYDPVYAGEELKIEFNKPLWLPFFTTEFMEDYFATPDGSDYTFLCRESNWSGTQWHDAMVTDAEVRTATGFIYFLDRVVDQPPTADMYLRDNPDRYGVFYDMIQPFARYAQRTNDKGEVVFGKRYLTSKIYDISNPEGPYAGGGFHIMRGMFTLFMPGNDAWADYFNRNNIEDFNELSEITRIYLIQSHIISDLAFKSKLDIGMGSTFGYPLDIDTEKDITGSYLCNNAAIYDINKVLEPFIFKTVTGPVFLDDQYSTLLMALYTADKMNMVSSQDFDVTVFAVDNDQFLDIGVRYNSDDDEIQFLTRSEKWEEFKDIDLEKFIDGYIVKEKLKNLAGEGYFELVSGEYVYYNNNQLIAAGNAEAGEVVTITQAVENDVNGMLYYLDRPIRASMYTTAHRLKNDPDLTEFFNLMLSAGLVSVSEDPQTFDLLYRITFLQGANDWTILAPTNEAVNNARANGFLNEDNPQELKEFIYNHIIPKNVIFDDGLKSGTFETICQTGISENGAIYSELEIRNNLYDLVIVDATGQEVSVPHVTANQLVQAGVYHKIPMALHK